MVNLNTATAAQIATLPGIGEKVAQRIIDYREKSSGFKTIEDCQDLRQIRAARHRLPSPMVSGELLQSPVSSRGLAVPATPRA
jgi:competence protein ComEA